MKPSAVTADALWVEVDRLYENRGPGVPGNQLDLPRGSRVFFGFSDRDVPRNTTLGEIMVQCSGKRIVGRNMRFANNSMDKLNLPVPLTDGPPSYDSSHLLFTRRPEDAARRRCFQLDLGDAAALASWRSRAKTEEVISMAGGRQMGLLWW